MAHLRWHTSDGTPQDYMEQARGKYGREINANVILIRQIEGGT